MRLHRALGLAAAAVALLASGCTSANAPSEPAAGVTAAAPACVAQVSKDQRGLLIVADVWPKLDGGSYYAQTAKYAPTACHEKTATSLDKPNCAAGFPWVTSSAADQVLGANGATTRLLGGIRNGETGQEVIESVVVFDTNHTTGLQALEHAGISCGATRLDRTAPDRTYSMNSGRTLIGFVNDPVLGSVAVKVDINGGGWNPDNYNDVFTLALRKARTLL